MPGGRPSRPVELEALETIKAKLLPELPRLLDELIRLALFARRERDRLAAIDLSLLRLVGKPAEASLEGAGGQAIRDHSRIVEIVVTPDLHDAV